MPRCTTCERDDCNLCQRLEAIGLPKPFVRRMVNTSIGVANGNRGERDDEFRLTSDELVMFRVKTDNAPPGTSIRMPGEIKFVVDNSMAQCIACEDETFEVQAKDVGWHYGTRLPDGESAWLCRECVRADVDPPQF